jgi:hypothetical protein
MDPPWRESSESESLFNVRAESISLYMATGESETVPNAASTSFENGQVDCRDRDGLMLRSMSASALAFASRSPDMGGLNVWI